MAFTVLRTPSGYDQSTVPVVLGGSGILTHRFVHLRLLTSEGVLGMDPPWWMPKHHLYTSNGNLKKTYTNFACRLAVRFSTKGLGYFLCGLFSWNHFKLHKQDFPILSNEYCVYSPIAPLTS